MVLKLVCIQRRADGGWHNAAYVDTTKKGKRRDVGALIFGYPCESIIAERELSQMEMFSERTVVTMRCALRFSLLCESSASARSRPWHQSSSSALTSVGWGRGVETGRWGKVVSYIFLAVSTVMSISI